jgi:hypothetical protein
MGEPDKEMTSAEGSDSEIELTSDDLASLSDGRKVDSAALPVAQATAVPSASQQSVKKKPSQTSNAPRALSRAAMFIGLTFAAIAGAIAMYTHSQTSTGKRVQVAWKPAFPQPAGETAAVEPEEIQPQGPPVKFANPFDRSEVFEFPPGTSRSAARDAVAEILLQRAAERERSARN